MATEMISDDNNGSGSKRRTFFGENRPAKAAAFNAPRPITGAAQVLNLNKASSSGYGRASSSAHQWQTAAWGFSDQIGELKFAFNLVAQIASRAMLYPAILTDTAEVPVDAELFLERLQNKTHTSPPVTREAVVTAENVVGGLFRQSQAQYIRRMALNLSIPGEFYLVDNNGKIVIASSSEFTPGSTSYLSQHKDGTEKIQLPPSTYAARVWRPHPRYFYEPDSSMLGVLDSCEKIAIFDQESRINSRSRLNAGLIAIPNGIVPITEGEDIMEMMTKLTISPVETEESGATVTPAIVTGPADAIKEIQRIELGRANDEYRLAEYELALDRVLAGVDIPKDMVSGLADVKYSNALVIDDSLYKAHIEPLLMLICDSLTFAYLRPALRAAGVAKEFVDRIVIWYNPSQIVTRPDRSQAANEGFDKFLLSEKTWREARGFTDDDAPTEDEIIRRLAREKATVSPELATVLIESLHPEFFAAVRARNQEAAGVPPEVTDILEGQPGGPVPSDETEYEYEEEPAAAQQQSGGEITPGGSLPPRVPNPELAL